MHYKLVRDLAVLFCLVFYDILFLGTEQVCPGSEVHHNGKKYTFNSNGPLANCVP